MSDSVVAPELRFNEFSYEWKIKPLGDVTRYTKGFAFKSENYRGKGVRIVRVSDLGVDHIKHDNEKIYFSAAESSNCRKYLLEKGNIIITTVGSRPELRESAVGRGVYIEYDNEGLLNQNLLKFENVEGINNKFLFAQINSQRYIGHITSISRGNANQSNITVKELLEYKIGLTEENEQQKIAAFLASIDDKLNKLRRKRELLESWKCGLMQKLFTQALCFDAQGSANVAGAGSAGVTTQNDGTAFPDWEEKLLIDIANINMGSSPSSAAYNSLSMGLPLLQGNADIKNRISSPRTYTYEITKECFPNDILLSVRAPVGEISISMHHACIGRGMAAIRVNEKAIQDFLFQYLRWFEPRWKKISQGSTFEAVNTKDVQGLILLIPSIQEQQKIANFLSSVDKKIEAVTQQINTTETFKKGLLQKMFV